MPSLGIGGSSSSSSQKVDKNQQPFLDFLRNSAQWMAESQYGDQNINRNLGRLGAGLNEAGQGFLGQLQSNPFMDSLQQQSQYDSGRVWSQADQLGKLLGREFNQNIMPGIQTEAIGLGGGGGSRQGVAEGIAAQGMADTLQRGIWDIDSAERQRNLQASTTGAGINAQSALGGINSLGSLFNMGMAPYQAQFMPLMNMNQIVGPPTVLGSSSSNAFNIGGSPS